MICACLKAWTTTTITIFVVVLLVTTTARPSTGQNIVLSGWFHIIFNGSPRYVLVDDQGGSHELLLDENLTKPFGGPAALNQKRVRIEGERVNDSSKRVRVILIHLE